MARQPRLVLAGHPHLVIQRGRVGATVFADAADRNAYLEALGLALKETGVALHGYAMLAAEARLLLTPMSAPALARFVQATGRRHVRAVNARTGQRGSPWDGRFRSALVDASTSFLDCLRYAEADGEEALASSLPHHVGASVDPHVTDHPAYWSLGNTPFEREAAYRRGLEHPLDPALRAAIRTHALRGQPIGPPAFVRAAGAITGRRTVPGIRGRPRRDAL